MQSETLNKDFGVESVDKTATFIGDNKENSDINIMTLPL